MRVSLEEPWAICRLEDSKQQSLRKARRLWASWATGTWNSRPQDWLCCSLGVGGAHGVAYGILVP